VVAQNIELLDNKQSSGTVAAPSTSGYGMNSFGTEVFPEEEIPF